MRPSARFALFIGLLTTLLSLSLLDAGLRGGDAGDRIARMRRQVEALELTDLALFTEARYTRNPTQADWFTPFQDHPMALEHFPSGSLLQPPALLRRPR
ncbi:MAG TPA: hypothetical protein ENI96_07720 [Sedimenticola thiotaurini]|uniref:Uncharacterized protein n=1 Tax=Sedimenticola thiotaurini TaxID=1543721 RepID=A0A831W361_9GAMM|nr:hypothetical protein [Sedimenticola thiotaurini]